MKEMSRPNVFTFHDHLSLLTHWLNYLKKVDKEFSMRELAKKSKISVGYLPMVLSKKRELSSNALNKIIPHLKLNDNEKKYLFHLHKVGTSQIPSEREVHLKKMQKIKNYKMNNVNEFRTHEYLSSWLNVAIREMVSLPNFTVDVNWIQSVLQFKASQQDIIKSLSFLIEQKFISQDASQKWVQNDGLMDCQEGVYKLSLGEFHKSMMDLSKESIETVDRSSRYLKGHTVALNEDSYQKICEILNSSVQKIENINIEQNKFQEVYHLEICLFPLTANGFNKRKIGRQ